MGKFVVDAHDHVNEAPTSHEPGRHVAEVTLSIPHEEGPHKGSTYRRQPRSLTESTT